MIDTNYDFRSDTPPGKDPDKYSATLHSYHRALWSKSLPSGGALELSDGRPYEYLVHESVRGRLSLSSDAVVPSFGHKAKAVIEQLGPGEYDAFYHLGYTIGGMMLFPSRRVDGKMTINGHRGFHHQIADRFDLTIECIRRHYLGESSPLGPTLMRYADFFALFVDFRNYVEFWLLQDLINADDTVRFAAPFDNFTTSPVPQDRDAYRSYMANSIEFIAARNARIRRRS